MMRRAVRRRWLAGAGLALSTLIGLPAAGVLTTMAQSFPGAPPADVPPPPTVAGPAAERLSVAVAIGGSGTVASDALIPFEVFARSDRFSVYTVAASRTPAVLSGGVHVIPDHTFADPLPPPDVVVVPAVAAPAGDLEAPLRGWVAARAAGGSRVLGVCAGAEVLALAGLLDGRTATSHWAVLDRLRRSHPRADWRAGLRFVEDGPVVTTAGVTSATAGALHLVDRLAGAAEAERIGAALGYPGWSRDGDPTIPVHRWGAGDVPFALNAAFPWFRPTVGLAVADGVAETDVAAAAEVYGGGSFAARTLLVGARPTVLTRHGLRLAVWPTTAVPARVDRLLPVGAASPADAFGSALRDLAQYADRATALAAAAYLEYPAEPLTGPAWPWRPTALAAATLLLSAGLLWLTVRGPRPAVPTGMTSVMADQRAGHASR